jgi:hypothetical protein
MAGVEEVMTEAADMTEVEDNTEMEVRIGIKGMMNDVRKGKKGKHHYNTCYMRLNCL